MELILDVNWVEIIVGFVVAYAAGWLWYSERLFARRWRDGIRISSTDTSPMAPAMIAQAVGTFLFAWIINVATELDSMAFAIAIALTFAALVKANGFFSQKSKYAIMVESGYILVMVALFLVVNAII